MSTDHSETHSSDDSSSSRSVQKKKSDSHLHYKSNNDIQVPTHLQVQPCQLTLSNSRNGSPAQTPDYSPKSQPLKYDMKLNKDTLNVTSNSNNPPSPQDFPSDRSFEGSSEIGIDKTSLSLDGSDFQDSVNRSSESLKSDSGSSLKLTDSVSAKSDGGKSDKSSSKNVDKKEKKKGTAWYNILNPNYKSRNDDFKRLFKDLPETERLIVDYSCALQKDILVHGRLYVSQNYICFYANIFRWETYVSIRCRDITSMTKEKTARVIPNAVQVCTESEKHFFTSFGARDKTYVMLFRIWQNALLDQPMSSQELWHWVHYCYGDELGLTSDDDDYVAPALDEDSKSSSSTLHLDKRGLPKENGISDKLLENHAEVDERDHKSYSSNESPTELRQRKLSPCLGQLDGGFSSGTENQCQNREVELSSQSDDEDSDDEEIFCPCEGHDGKEAMNSVFYLSCDQAFSMIFTQSKFLDSFMCIRKTYDFVDGEWVTHPETGNKMRNISYTLTLNHSMAKYAPTTETQTMLKSSKPGLFYVVHCDVLSSGIPYADSFYVHFQYCITRVSSSSCRIRLHGGVKYKKSVWGLVKTIIEKTTSQGSAEYCADLEAALTKEAEILNEQAPTKKIKRKKRFPENLKTDVLKDSPKVMPSQASLSKIVHAYPDLQTGISLVTPELIIKIVIAAVLILLLFNVVLFYKLWDLESQNYLLKNPAKMVFQGEKPSTPEEWMQLLQRQEVLHRAEVERWRTAIGDLVNLIHLLEESLQDLKNHMDVYAAASKLFHDNAEHSKTAQPSGMA